MEYGVRVYSKSVHFSSSHVIIGDSLVESLHGHTYSVDLKIISKQLDSQGFVIDFSICKDLLKSICNDFDKKVLIARNNPYVTVADEVRIDMPNSTYYKLPLSTCVILDLNNSSTEELAGYITRRIHQGLHEKSGIFRIETRVAELRSSQEGLFSLQLT